MLLGKARMNFWSSHLIYQICRPHFKDDTTYQGLFNPRWQVTKSKKMEIGAFGKIVLFIENRVGHQHAYADLSFILIR